MFLRSDSAATLYLTLTRTGLSLFSATGLGCGGDAAFMISLTSGQLVSELFPDCKRSCFSVMIRGPSFIVSTMQEETTPIFKRIWYDWTQQQPGIEPTNPLGQCWAPPIVAFYDQQGLLTTHSIPGGSIRRPHPRSPRGNGQRSQHCCKYSWSLSVRTLAANSGSSMLTIVLAKTKNDMMLQYPMWHLLTSEIQDIKISFMISGHTKFGPDRYFGLLKKKYRAHTKLTQCMIFKELLRNHHQLVTMKPSVSGPRHRCLFVRGISFYVVPSARVIFAAKTSLDIFSLSRDQVWTFSVLGDQIYEMRCLSVAVGLNARFIVLPHWDNMS